ncbi:MAG: hypothetical protein WBB84_04280, partial [Candidatus Omnitrophota bacterium]
FYCVKDERVFVVMGERGGRLKFYRRGRVDVRLDTLPKVIEALRSVDPGEAVFVKIDGKERTVRSERQARELYKQALYAGRRFYILRNARDDRARDAEAKGGQRAGRLRTLREVEKAFQTLREGEEIVMTTDKKSTKEIKVKSDKHAEALYQQSELYRAKFYLVRGSKKIRLKTLDDVKKAFQTLQEGEEIVMTKDKQGTQEITVKSDKHAEALYAQVELYRAKFYLVRGSKKVRLETLDDVKRALRKLKTDEKVVVVSNSKEKKLKSPGHARFLLDKPKFYHRKEKVEVLKNLGEVMREGAALKGDEEIFVIINGEEVKVEGMDHAIELWRKGPEGSQVIGERTGLWNRILGRDGRTAVLNGASSVLMTLVTLGAVLSAVTGAVGCVGNVNLAPHLEGQAYQPLTVDEARQPDLVFSAPEPDAAAVPAAVVTPVAPAEETPFSPRAPTEDLLRITGIKGRFGLYENVYQDVYLMTLVNDRPYAPRVRCYNELPTEDVTYYFMDGNTEVKVDPADESMRSRFARVTHMRDRSGNVYQIHRQQVEQRGRERTSRIARLRLVVLDEARQNIERRAEGWPEVMKLAGKGYLFLTGQPLEFHLVRDGRRVRQLDYFSEVESAIRALGRNESIETVVSIHGDTVNVRSWKAAQRTYRRYNGHKDAFLNEARTLAEQGRYYDAAARMRDSVAALIRETAVSAADTSPTGLAKLIAISNDAREDWYTQLERVSRPVRDSRTDASVSLGVDTNWAISRDTDVRFGGDSPSAFWGAGITIQGVSNPVKWDVVGQGLSAADRATYEARSRLVDRTLRTMTTYGYWAESFASIRDLEARITELNEAREGVRQGRVDADAAEIAMEISRTRDEIMVERERMAELVIELSNLTDVPTEYFEGMEPQDVNLDEILNILEEQGIERGILQSLFEERADLEWAGHKTREADHGRARVKTFGIKLGFPIPIRFIFSARRASQLTKDMARLIMRRETMESAAASADAAEQKVIYEELINIFTNYLASVDGIAIEMEEAVREARERERNGEITYRAYHGLRVDLDYVKSLQRHVSGEVEGIIRRYRVQLENINILPEIARAPAREIATVEEVTPQVVMERSAQHSRQVGRQRVAEVERRIAEQARREGEEKHRLAFEGAFSIGTTPAGTARGITASAGGTLVVRTGLGERKEIARLAVERQTQKEALLRETENAENIKAYTYLLQAQADAEYARARVELCGQLARSTRDPNVQGQLIRARSELAKNERYLAEQRRQVFRSAEIDPAGVRRVAPLADEVIANLPVDPRRRLRIMEAAVDQAKMLVKLSRAFGDEIALPLAYSFTRIEGERTSAELHNFIVGLGGELCEQFQRGSITKAEANRIQERWRGLLQREEGRIQAAEAAAVAELRALIEEKARLVVEERTLTEELGRYSERMRTEGDTSLSRTREIWLQVSLADLRASAARVDFAIQRARLKVKMTGGTESVSVLARADTIARALDTLAMETYREMGLTSLPLYEHRQGFDLDLLDSANMHEVALVATLILQIDQIWTNFEQYHVWNETTQTWDPITTDPFDPGLDDMLQSEVDMVQASVKEDIIDEATDSQWTLTMDLRFRWDPRGGHISRAMAAERRADQAEIESSRRDARIELLRQDVLRRRGAVEIAQLEQMIEALNGEMERAEARLAYARNRAAAQEGIRGLRELKTRIERELTSRRHEHRRITSQVMARMGYVGDLWAHTEPGRIPADVSGEEKLDFARLAAADLDDAQIERIWNAIEEGDPSLKELRARVKAAAARAHVPVTFWQKLLQPHVYFSLAGVSFGDIPTFDTDLAEGQDYFYGPILGISWQIVNPREAADNAQRWLAHMARQAELDDERADLRRTVISKIEMLSLAAERIRGAEAARAILEGRLRGLDTSIEEMDVFVVRDVTEMIGENNRTYRNAAFDYIFRLEELKLLGVDITKLPREAAEAGEAAATVEEEIELPVPATDIVYTPGSEAELTDNDLVTRIISALGLNDMDLRMISEDEAIRLERCRDLLEHIANLRGLTTDEAVAYFESVIRWNGAIEAEGIGNKQIPQFFATYIYPAMSIDTAGRINDPEKGTNPNLFARIGLALFLQDYEDFIFESRGFEGDEGRRTANEIVAGVLGEIVEKIMTGRSNWPNWVAEMQAKIQQLGLRIQPGERERAERSVVPSTSKAAGRNIRLSRPRRALDQSAVDVFYHFMTTRRLSSGQVRALEPLMERLLPLLDEWFGEITYESLESTPDAARIYFLKGELTKAREAGDTSTVSYLERLIERDRNIMVEKARLQRLLDALVLLAEGHMANGFTIDQFDPASLSEGTLNTYIKRIRTILQGMRDGEGRFYPEYKHPFFDMFNFFYRRTVPSRLDNGKTMHTHYLSDFVTVNAYSVFDGIGGKIVYTFGRETLKYMDADGEEHEIEANIIYVTRAREDDTVLTEPRHATESWVVKPGMEGFNRRTGEINRDEAYLHKRFHETLRDRDGAPVTTWEEVRDAAGENTILERTWNWQVGPDGRTVQGATVIEENHLRNETTTYSIDPADHSKWEWIERVKRNGDGKIIQKETRDMDRGMITQEYFDPDKDVDGDGQPDLSETRVFDLDWNVLRIVYPEGHSKTVAPWGEKVEGRTPSVIVQYSENFPGENANRTYIHENANKKAGRIEYGKLIREVSGVVIDEGRVWVVEEDGTRREAREGDMQTVRTFVHDLENGTLYIQYGDDAKALQHNRHDPGLAKRIFIKPYAVITNDNGESVDVEGESSIEIRQIGQDVNGRRRIVEEDVVRRNIVVEEEIAGVRVKRVYA